MARRRNPLLAVSTARPPHDGQMQSQRTNWQAQRSIRFAQPGPNEMMATTNDDEDIIPRKKHIVQKPTTAIDYNKKHNNVCTATFNLFNYTFK